MRRARERAEKADLVLWLAEDGTPPPAFAALVWEIATKADLHRDLPSPLAGEGARRADEGCGQSTVSSETPPHLPASPAPSPARGEGEPLPISTLTDGNLDALLARLAAFAQDLAAPAGTSLIARARHREAFAAALAALDRAAATPAPPIEIVAEDLRTARFALDRLIGAVDVEDILGDIFARFCIGK